MPAAAEAQKLPCLGGAWWSVIEDDVHILGGAGLRMPSSSLCMCTCAHTNKWTEDVSTQTHTAGHGESAPCRRGRLPQDPDIGLQLWNYGMVCIQHHHAVPGTRRSPSLYHHTWQVRVYRGAWCTRGCCLSPGGGTPGRQRCVEWSSGHSDGCPRGSRSAGGGLWDNEASSCGFGGLARDEPCAGGVGVSRGAGV